MAAEPTTAAEGMTAEPTTAVEGMTAESTTATTEATTATTHKLDAVVARIALVEGGAGAGQREGGGVARDRRQRHRGTCEESRSQESDRAHVVSILTTRDDG
jgi:hypothetical protein